MQWNLTKFIHFYSRHAFKLATFSPAGWASGGCSPQRYKFSRQRPRQPNYRLGGNKCENVGAANTQQTTRPACRRQDWTSLLYIYFTIIFLGSDASRGGGKSSPLCVQTGRGGCMLLSILIARHVEKKRPPTDQVAYTVPLVDRKERNEHAARSMQPPRRAQERERETCAEFHPDRRPFRQRCIQFA